MVSQNNLRKMRMANGGGADIKYIVRRFMKFYSGYWIILAICLPIGIFLFGRPLCASDSLMESAKMWIREIFAIAGHHSYNVSWWFNALIISFYLLFPLLYYGVKYTPIMTLAISVILNHSSIMKISMDMSHFMFIFVVGIAMAVHYKSFNTLWNRLPKWALWTICFFALAGPAIALPIIDGDSVYYRGLYWFALLTIGMVMLIILGVRKLPILNSLLSTLGKHSANIYLMHTLIFYYWFPDFFYSMRYPFVIFSVLMIICFSISWSLEYLKKCTGYSKLTNMIIDKIR